MTEPNEFSTDYTNDPVCPHCGHKYRDAWEINFGGDIEGNTTITCGECDEGFEVFRHIEVTYCTYLPKPKN